MDIIIKADPKEIADLVLAIQGQPNRTKVKLTVDGEELANVILENLPSHDKLVKEQ